MYSLVELPQLPTDARLIAASAPQSFIDEIEIHSLFHHHRQNWQEQRYLGEDFAGRDDCLLSSDDAHIVPHRQEIGAFFAPVAVTQTPSPAVISLAPTSSSRRMPWVIAAASTLLLATGLSGLWANRQQAPAAATVPQASNTMSRQDSYAKSKTALIVIDKRH